MRRTRSFTQHDRLLQRQVWIGTWQLAECFDKCLPQCVFPVFMANAHAHYAQLFQISIETSGVDFQALYDERTRLRPGCEVLQQPIEPGHAFRGDRNGFLRFLRHAS